MGVREEGVLKQDMPFLSKKNSEGHLVPAHVDNQPPLLADEDPTSSNDSDPWKMGPSPFLWPLWFGHSGHLLALVSTKAPSLLSVAQLFSVFACYAAAYCLDLASICYVLRWPSLPVRHPCMVPWLAE